jgi:hypothetical protein
MPTGTTGIAGRLAAPVVARAANVLPAPLAPRIVIRALPEGATW